MNRKQSITLGIIAAVAILALIAFAAWQTNQQQTKNNQQYQPLSEINGTDKHQIQFLNVGALTDQGATSAQAQSMQAAFEKFKPTAEQIIIFSPTVKTNYDSTKPDAIPTATFTVTIDNTTYNAKIEYHTLQSNGAMRLYLNDLNNKQVYDSGIYDSSVAQ